MPVPVPLGANDELNGIEIVRVSLERDRLESVGQVRGRELPIQA